MGLTKEEKETSIQFNDAGDAAVICTCNLRWLRKMDKLAEKDNAVTCLKRVKGYGEYSFPKNWVRVQKPNAQTEKQRKESGDRLRAFRRNGGEGSEQQNQT